MELLRSIASTVVAGLLSLFAGRSAIASLILISLAVGIAMLWVFARTSNQPAIRKVKARLGAHLYEMRLFADEPMLVWKAQWDLLKANARYIALMLTPALVLTIPMLLLFGQLDAFYGYTPLVPGRAAIVTMQLATPSSGPAPELQAPDGIVVETPPVRAEGGRQISWRIRALRPAAGQMRFTFAGGTVEKSIAAGNGPQYVSGRRVRSAMDLVWYPAESRLPTDGPVEWIELRYPRATVQAVGLDLHWVVWLLVFSMAGALLFKGRFRVSF